MLSGFRVLDLSRVLAGPLCAMILGDMGADVIKVERPGGGDDTRGWGPPFDSRGVSAYFRSLNRNKLSIAADFSVEADRRLILELIAGADVVVDNFLPGVLARHGLGPAALIAAHDRLIWCTISGFGPGSRRPGYDFVVQAESGWMAITGAEDGAPMKTGVALVDVIAGKDAALAILSALVARERGTLAQRHLHVSLSNSAVASLVNIAENVRVSGEDAPRWGNAHPNLVPYQLFEAADRGLVIAVGSDAQWLALTAALGLSREHDDLRLRTNTGRLAFRDEVVRAIAGRIREHSAGHWMEVLRKAGVPSGIVLTVQQALEVSEKAAEKAVESDLTSDIFPAIPASARLEPPLLDEHGVAIRKNHWNVFTLLPILKS